MIYSTKWNDMDSFRLFPANELCPFVEAIYNPETKILAVLSKNKIVRPMMIPKLNNNGEMFTKYDSIVEERKDMETFYEYYIETQEDIKSFVEQFAINTTHSSLNILA